MRVFNMRTITKYWNYKAYSEILTCAKITIKK